MNSKLTALAAAIMVAAATGAQTPKRDFKRDIRLSASNLLAYPGPDNSRKMTPAPDSLKPFYISHYGRHGSRFLIDPEDYAEPLATLHRADSMGKLTLRGRDLMRRISWMQAEADGRLGELTEIGARQHRGIARRMYERFPEVFAPGAHIDARSTVVIRCILSMENELMELVRLNPALNVSHDASQHDMVYMNFANTAPTPSAWTPEAREAMRQLYDSMVDTVKVMRRLFSDMDYAREHVGMRRLNDQLFRLASATQNSDARYKVTLYDVFDDNDIYANWVCNNAGWYLGYACCPINGGRQPLTQRNLLNNIINEADSCIKLAGTGASLRFGHETVLLPLVCLMGLDGYGMSTDDLRHLDRKGWIDYKIFPMGSNVQIVFYRKDASDTDPVVKVLLNENEAKLPIKAVSGPYYRWSDVRGYWLERMATMGKATTADAD